MPDLKAAAHSNHCDELVPQEQGQDWAIVSAIDTQKELQGKRCRI